MGSSARRPAAHDGNVPALRQETRSRRPDARCPLDQRSLEASIRATRASVSALLMPASEGGQSSPVARSPDDACPRTAIKSQRSPTATPAEPEGNEGFEPASNAWEHARNV